MPRFRTTTAVASREVTVQRARCDGCDLPRAIDEHCHRSELWLVTQGAFELRDRGGRRVLDPTRAIVLAAGDPFVVRHPVGPDVCLSIRGPLVDALAEGGTRVLPLEAGAHAGLVGAVAAVRAGRGDELAVAEAVVGLAGGGGAEVGEADGAWGSGVAGSGVAGAGEGRGAGGARGRARDRDLAVALADALRVAFAEQVELSDLAAATGASVFHACRVFRRVTGTTLSGFRRELRLRHALAMVLDGDAPLADVAAEVGFASQSHLTNLFRDRFGSTPGRARARRAL